MKYLSTASPPATEDPKAVFIAAIASQRPHLINDGPGTGNMVNARELARATPRKN